jgi:protein-disulfide isomerase
MCERKAHTVPADISNVFDLKREKVADSAASPPERSLQFQPLVTSNQQPATSPQFRYHLLMRNSRLLASLLGATLLAGACSRTAAQQTPMPGPNDVVASVNGTAIRLADVDEKALQQATSTFGGMKLSQALYEARQTTLDTLIDDTLIDQDAKARGLDRAAVIQQDITAKVAAVTSDDIAAWFKENQARLQGATLDQVQTAIRGYLVQQRTLDARRQYVDRLRSKATLRVTLEPPRMVVSKADRPTKGPVTAPIEMIEFSDFQCPFCERAFPTVTKVLSEYGDKIHFVYRHYPLNGHPQARPAAEAAQCAAEQGKFWPYHDRLFGDQTKLGDADLKKTAAELGMNAEQFNACVDSHKYKDEVDADIRAGDEVGVNGTPAFFINGRELTGAQPYEVFKSVIDNELARKNVR